MSKKIPSQFSVGSGVRIVRVAFPGLPSHTRCIGKTGIVQKYEPSVGAVVVLIEDGSTRVCFPENLEVISKSNPPASRLAANGCQSGNCEESSPKSELLSPDQDRSLSLLKRLLEFCNGLLPTDR